MSFRKIIKIDEDKCNGCGLCITNCAEGALKIIDGKARVVKDSFCDGLGACIGHCPQDALTIVEREADEFDMDEAMKHKDGHKPDQVHHGEGGCPGSRMRILNNTGTVAAKAAAVGNDDIEIKIKSQLGQWPVQLSLVPVNAPFYKNADLLVTADCVPFAYPNYHLDLLKGKAVVVGCPKLDDIEAYTEKLTRILENNDIKSVTVAFMEVPCCTGIMRAVENAAALSGKDLEINRVRIGINGDMRKV